MERINTGSRCGTARHRTTPHVTASRPALHRMHFTPVPYALRCIALIALGWCHAASASCCIRGVNEALRVVLTVAAVRTPLYLHARKTLTACSVGLGDTENFFHDIGIVDYRAIVSIAQHYYVVYNASVYGELNCHFSPATCGQRAKSSYFL